MQNNSILSISKRQDGHSNIYSDENRMEDETLSF
jgi:hypothetical protein